MSGPVAPSPFEAGIGDHEFGRIRTLVEREGGIHLGPAKRALVVGRLSKRIRELGLPSFREYCQRVEDDPVERVELLDRITTNETHFWREPRHFELIERELLPRWRAEADRGLRRRLIRAWSAACSTGEEPFTLAMVLLRAFPPGSGWEIEILASDLSCRALRRAEAATWPLARAAEIPPADLRRFMLRGVGPQEGHIRAAPELRDLVRFARINLVEALPSVGIMDLIFCRNVLIYFDGPVKHAVVERLVEHLAPDGHLFLGHAESLAGSVVGARNVAPSVYRRDPHRAQGAGR